MADRTPQLLEHLSRAEGWVAASELASRLGVSTRTVRSYVTAIKAAAGPLEVITSSTSGYRLNREAYSEYARAAEDRASSPTGPRERVAYLVSRLTQASGPLGVHELASALYVSDSTIEADLRRVRRLARECGAELVRSGDAVEVRGPEDAQRRLLSRIFREETSGTMFDLRQVQRAFAVGDLGAFKTDVIALLQSSGYAVNELGLDGVLVHTAIAVERARRSLPPAGSTTPSEAPELQESLAAIVEEHFGATLPTGELAALTLLLTTRVGTRRAGPAVRGDPEVADDVDVLRRLVRRAEREYLIDLDDDDFLLRLALHVRNLVSRSRAGALTRNPLTRSIKTSYPLTYELAVFLAREIQREFGITVNDDEIAFIALHVGSHLDRHAGPQDEVTAVLVVPAYHDLAAVTRERIEAAAGVHVVRVVERTDASLDGRLGADLVLTTLPGVLRTETVVPVGPFPTDADVEAVRSAVARVRRHRRRSRIADELLLYFDERLFVRNPDTPDEAAVIRLLGDRMIELGLIDEPYLDGVLERERLSSTAFTESLAVPHSMAMNARRTAIAVAVFGSPVPWGDGLVSVVALVAFSDEGRTAFQTVFEQFVEVFSDRADVQRLLQGSADFASFIEQLVLLIDS